MALLLASTPIATPHPFVDLLLIPIATSLSPPALAFSPKAIELCPVATVLLPMAIALLFCAFAPSPMAMAL